MTILFVDIKYVIIFSLLQYCTTMVLKSPKHYTSRFMKKQSKTTFYIHNTYKARRNLDYTYTDWEEKKSDIYDYLLPSMNQTSTTASDNFAETSSQTMFYPETPTNPTLGSSQSNTLFTFSATYPTLPSTESTPETSLPILYTDSTTLPILPSLTIPYNITTTNPVPEVSTGNIITGTTTPTTVIDDAREPVKDELLNAEDILRGGFFTASIYVLLKIVEKKKSEDLSSLLIGFQAEFSRLNSHHRLAMFGPMVNSVFTFIVLNMATVPVELIQIQAKNGQELIENKRTALELDTKAIFDVIDTIYTQEDIINIVDSLTDIQNFPNLPKQGIDVAREAMEAFFFQPYSRIQGTAKEKLLLMEIHDIVEKRMAVDESKNIRINFRKNIKMNTTMMTSSENITKFIDKKITKAQLRINIEWPTLYTDPTTINSSETDFTSYVTDPKIMKQLKHKMRIYKKKIKQIRSQERKKKTKRGPTSTTTTTTTTTVMPPMRKSKYYWRKYVKKNLYKMKISTKKTTKFLWRYYGKIKTIRRFMGIDNFETTIYSLSNSSSDSDYNYSDSDEDDYETDAHKSNYFTRSIKPTEFKSVSRFNSIKNDITNDMVSNNEEVNKIQRSESTPESSDSYYFDSDDDNYGTGVHKSNNIIRPMTPTDLKYVSRYKVNKNKLTNHILHNNNNIIKDAESKTDIQDINKIQKSVNKPESSDSNAEAYLQVHLNDALIHTNNITINRRFIKKKVNKLRKFESFSDDEAILKGNIYKVFGYSNDFAKQLRTMFKF